MVELIPMPDHDTEELQRRLKEREAEEKRVASVLNERIKLTAGMISQVGVVFFTIGVVTPLLTVGVRRLEELSFATGICIVAWVGLHLAARQLLRGLK